MTRRAWVLGIFSVILLITTACSPRNQSAEHDNTSPQEPIFRETNNPSRLGAVRRDNSDINGHENAATGGQNEIGYFRYNPANYRTNGRKIPQSHNVFVDRPILAKHIAQLVTVLPGVKEATALVTDDHVFIGVRTKNGKHNPKIIKEAKRTAEAVTPRYFKVHVTDSQKLESQINSVGMRMRTNNDVEGVRGDLEQLLRKMGDETPPDVNEDNNPNSKTQIGY
ncbi:YhcN/YlaJ family sporulation lipoprotein [Thermoflavimicrobium daqui]|nr:YhcN/YlaJ family sporulation lipoprotein [Thermoflavimicrobium daqui]